MNPWLYLTGIKRNHYLVDIDYDNDTCIVISSLHTASVMKHMIDLSLLHCGLLECTYTNYGSNDIKRGKVASLVMGMMPQAALDEVHLKP